MNQPALASESPNRSRLSVRDGMALALIMVFAALLRLPQANSSLWLDELHTSWAVADGVSQIAPRAMYGNQSPLYFNITAAPWEALGRSEWTLRAPALAAGLLLVLAVYVVVLRWTSLRSAAVLAGLLAALDRDALFYSLEARPYALVQLGGVLHVCVWSRVVMRPSFGWRLLAVSGGALLLYAHYTAALLFVAEWIWLGAMCRLRAAVVRYRPRQQAVDAALLVLLCLPAAPHAAWIAARRANWESIVQPQSIFELLSIFPLACYLLPPAALWALITVSRRGRRHTTTGGAARWDVALLAGCWLAVPLLLAWLATATGIAPLLLRRYVIVATAAPIVLSAIIYAACPQRAGRAICFAAVVVWAAIAPGGPAINSAGQAVLDGPLSRYVLTGEFVDRPRENWRAAIAAINRDAAAANLPVLLRSGLIEDDALRAAAVNDKLRAYCLFPVRGLYPIEESQRMLIPLPSTDSGRLWAAAQQQIVDQQGAWLLLRASPGDAQAIHAAVAAGLEEQGVATYLPRRETFGGVVLMQIRTAPSK